MKFIPKPTYSSEQSYSLCQTSLSTQADIDLASSIKPTIESTNTLYWNKSEDPSFFEITPHGENHVSFMKRLYEEQMVAKNGTARKIYDSIMSLAPDLVCPFCNQLPVATLDHYLPKYKFPYLGVNPINLVPACSDCNDAKGTRFPRTYETQSIHPYFDDFTGERWLFARVLEQENTTLEFFPDATIHYPNDHKRIHFHFERYKIKRLYEISVVSELQNIREDLEAVLDSSGSLGLKQYLTTLAKRRERVFKNSLQTAMYYGLAESDWFCEVGPSKIAKPLGSISSKYSPTPTSP